MCIFYLSNIIQQQQCGVFGIDVKKVNLNTNMKK